MRASWKPLIVGGAWNPELRKIAREASGVYVVRRAADRVVLYVGMSEQGVMWKTLQRHFQAWKTLPDFYWSHDGKALVRGRETFQHGRPELLEAALFVTSTGKRPKSDPDRKARDLELSMIRRYQPRVNVDPGHAWDERGGAPVSRSRKPRAGSVAATRAEDVPEETPDDAGDAWEPTEDASDDPDDPFAVRNPAEREPRRGGRCELCDDFRLAKKGQTMATKRNPPKKRDEKREKAASAKLAREARKVASNPDRPDNEEREELGERVAEVLRENGYGAKVWTGARVWTGEDKDPSLKRVRDVRIFVTRELSRRRQDMGFVRVEPDGHLSFNGLEREKAGLRDLLATAISPPSPPPIASPPPRPEGYGVEETGKGRAGQIRMFNPPMTAKAARPRGALVTLGALTEIIFRGATGHEQAMRWSLRSAPLLAYDTAGRLFVVYAEAAVGKASKAARKSYAKTHWGKPGRGNELEGAIVVGAARVSGVGISVTYTTQKGADAQPVDYVHAWGEGAREKWKAPLVVHDGTDHRVAFSGGTYRVTERGIVG